MGWYKNAISFHLYVNLFDWLLGREKASSYIGSICGSRFGPTAEALSAWAKQAFQTFFVIIEWKLTAEVRKIHPSEKVIGCPRVLINHIAEILIFAQQTLKERERGVKVYHHRQTCFFTEEAKTTENVNKPPTQTPCSSLLTATEKKKILKGEKREKKVKRITGCMTL